VRDIVYSGSPIWRAGGFTVLASNAARTIARDRGLNWLSGTSARHLAQYFAIQSVAGYEGGQRLDRQFQFGDYHAMTPKLSVYQAAKAAVIGMTRPGPHSGPTRSA
jgi:NAD(P)-dependent dehydrogenase (short-subunit alcohol dehydrogenase family)